MSQIRESCGSALIMAFPLFIVRSFMLQSFKGQAAESTCFDISKGPFIATKMRYFVKSQESDTRLDSYSSFSVGKSFYPLYKNGNSNIS